MGVSFRRHLQAEQRKPQTIKTYLAAIRSLTEVIGDRPCSLIDRDAVREFLIERGEQVSPSTLSIEFRALRVFFRWLVDEDEIPESPLDRLKGPRVPETPPPIYSDAEIEALLGACANSRSRYAGVRDAAIILTLLDCGMRRSELANIRLQDVDLDQQVIYLAITKNGSPRTVPVGQRTTTALDRLIRARDHHVYADSEYLFVGQAGPLTDNGIYLALRERGRQAGVDAVRPHRFRHSWAHRASMNGMQTQDLMTIAGWRNVQQVLRYGRSAATERAIAAHRVFSPVDAI